MKIFLTCALAAAFAALLINSCHVDKLNSIDELVDLSNGPEAAGSDLWRGTFYCGDREGQSVFLIRLNAKPDRWITLPASGWTHQERFQFTRDQSKWIDFDKVVEGVKSTGR